MIVDEKMKGGIVNITEEKKREIFETHMNMLVMGDGHTVVRINLESISVYYITIENNCKQIYCIRIWIYHFMNYFFKPKHVFVPYVVSFNLDRSKLVSKFFN